MMFLQTAEILSAAGDVRLTGHWPGLEARAGSIFELNFSGYFLSREREGRVDKLIVCDEHRQRWSVAVLQPGLHQIANIESVE